MPNYRPVNLQVSPNPQQAVDAQLQAAPEVRAVDATPLALPSPAHGNGII